MADNDNNLVFTVSSDMSAAQRGLAKFAVDVGASADQIARKYASAGAKIDGSVSALQSRINGVVGIGAKVSKEWTGALADQGKELERLRARYSPLFATINNYKQAVTDIRRAHAIGAISANEMAAAISKERQAALASTAAIKGRNAALADTPTQRSSGGGGAYQTANIAAQFQDIAVTSAMGMSPLQIALQQGTQLSSVLSTFGNGKSAVAGLAAAFGSLVSPISLATIALVAGSAAAVQYFSSVASGGEQSEEALKKEAELIQAVASKWGDVLPELKKYADERQKLLDTKEQKDAAAAAANQQWSDLRKTVGDVKVAFVDVRSQIEAAGGDAEAINALQKSFNELTKGIADGSAKAEQAQAVQKALADLATQTGVPAIAEFAKTFDGLATSVDSVADAATRLKNGPLFNENFSKSKLPTLGTLGPIFSDNGKLLTDPNEIDRYMKQQEDNRNPTIDTGNGVPVPVPTPTAKPIQLGEEPDKEIAKAETAAQKAANAYRDLLKSASDRIAQVQQEIDLLGKYGVEADAARFALDLMQQSEDKGRSLSEAQRKEIEKKVELYKQYSDALAKAKLSQDLLDGQRLGSMSERDRQITTTLRQYGLSDDLSSDQAAAIGKQYDRQQIKDAAKGFGDAFSSELVTGSHDIGKSFMKGFEAELTNQATKLWAKFFDSIGNMLADLLTGTKSGTSSTAAAGGIVSNLLAGASTPNGKVGGSSIATGDIASYISQAAVKRGIDPEIALKVARSEGGLKSWNMQSTYFKNGIQEPSFGPYQLYMGGGLGNAFQKQTGLDPRLAANGPAGVDFALDNAAKSGWGAWYGAKKVGVGNWDGIGVGSAKTASEALDKLAASSGTATQGLGSLGTGLGQLGSSLGGAGGQGGGIGSWFSSLFGGAKGVSPTSSLWKPNTTYSAFLGLADGGHVTGEGGPTDDRIPAMLSNGEFVINSKATRKHRQLLEAINTGRVSRFATGGLVSSRSIGVPMAPQLASTARPANDNSAPGVLQVQISGANGDDHVRMLVKQGVGEGLSQYNENQRRGAFGQMQNRYTAQKG